MSMSVNMDELLKNIPDEVKNLPAGIVINAVVNGVDPRDIKVENGQVVFPVPEKKDDEAKAETKAEAKTETDTADEPDCETCEHRDECPDRMLCELLDRIIDDFASKFDKDEAADADDTKPHGESYLVPVTGFIRVNHAPDEDTALDIVKALVDTTDVTLNLANVADDADEVYAATMAAANGDIAKELVLGTVTVHAAGTR